MGFLLYLLNIKDEINSIIEKKLKPKNAETKFLGYTLFRRLHLVLIQMKQKPRYLTIFFEESFVQVSFYTGEYKEKLRAPDRSFLDGDFSTNSPPA